MALARTTRVSPFSKVAVTVSPLVFRPSSWRQARRKLLGVGEALEAEEVGAEEALDQPAPPRQLREQLDRREGDVVEPADAHVGAQLAHHLRHQLQLVVVHPHRRALGGDLADRLGEAAVDPLVGDPPVAVERGRHDDVVEDRPQGVVAEALVVLGDLVLGERHRAQVHAVLVEGLRGVTGVAGPPDPGALPPPHDRLHGGHQPAGAAPPLHAAVGQDHPVDGQAVGGDDQVKGAGTAGHAIISQVVAGGVGLLNPMPVRPDLHKGRMSSQSPGSPSRSGAVPLAPPCGAVYLRTMRISDVVRRKGDKVFTVRPDDTVEQLLALLGEHRIGALVVSEDGETVSGIVSERDVVWRLASDGAAILRAAHQRDHDHRGAHLRPQHDTSRSSPAP